MSRAWWWALVAAAGLTVLLSWVSQGRAEPVLAGPGAQRTALEVRSWLVRQGFPVYDRPVWSQPFIESPWARDGELVLAVASPAGPVVVRALSDRGDLADVLIHEYLHSLRDVNEYAGLSPAERAVEEGVVTAVTDDLFPRFACAAWRECGPSGWLLFGESGDRYSRWAAMVRGVSRRATGRPVWSPQARAWRYRLVRADRAARAALWTEVTG